MDETATSICEVCGRPILASDLTHRPTAPLCQCQHSRMWYTTRAGSEGIAEGSRYRGETGDVGRPPERCWPVGGGLAYMGLDGRDECHDDMENYFNNHTAERLRIAAEEGSSETEDEDGRKRGAGGEERRLSSPPAPPHYGPGALVDDLDDLGDFIEADLPPRLYESSPSSSNASADCGSDDLELIFVEAAGDSEGESDVSAGVRDMLCDGVLPGILGGIPGGILGGVPGGIFGGVPGGILGGIPGGVPGVVPDSDRTRPSDATLDDARHASRCCHNGVDGRSPRALSRSQSDGQLRRTDVMSDDARPPLRCWGEASGADQLDGGRPSDVARTNTMTESHSDNGLGGTHAALNAHARVRRVQAVYGMRVQNGRSDAHDRERRNRTIGCEWDAAEMAAMTEDDRGEDGTRMPALGALIFSNFIRDYCRSQEAVECASIPPPSPRASPPPSPHPRPDQPPHLSDAEQTGHVMVWSRDEARSLQVSQIGTSACGATAIINVLKAFEVGVETSDLLATLTINQRAHHAPLPQYLLSRCVAGCTAAQLIGSVERLTAGYICGVFFHFYPPRDVALCSWLGDWIQRGAVPVVTINMQKYVPDGWPIPDAWHHQMVHGVGPKGVFLTNPLELVSEDVLSSLLHSDSEMLVRREDVVSRWSSDSDLGLLLRQTDTRWRDMNVLGQVVHVLREESQTWVPGFRPQLTSHINIPVAYRAGVSLFVRRHSAAHRLLADAAPQLPLRCHRSPPGGVTAAAADPT